MTDSINNAIPFVPENTIDPAAGLNLSVNVIDALLQLRVLTVGANTPPTGVEGARHIVGTSPTGAWSGKASKLARYLDGAWQFFDARFAVNAADGKIYVRASATWVSVDGSSGISYAPVITEATTARTLSTTDGGAYIMHTNSSDSTVTVAPQASQSWLANTEINIRREGAGNLTLTPGAGVTLIAPSGGTLVMTNAMSVTLKRVASDVWHVIGQTVAV